MKRPKDPPKRKAPHQRILLRSCVECGVDVPIYAIAQTIDKFRGICRDCVASTEGVE